MKRAYGRAHLLVVSAALMALASGCTRATLRPLQTSPATAPAAAASAAGPAPSRFTITAYCTAGRTASGTTTKTGVAAAALDFLPLGSVIRLEGLEERYNGVYTVMDTGQKVVGRQLDLYIRSCEEAVRFGRQTGEVSVLRLGWSPRATAADGRTGDRNAEKH
jgi:3D (Asp-Asp-Asp) domain-containing protein